MTLQTTSRWVLTIATTCTICGLLATGCGEQDLYEPPGSPYRVVGSLPLYSDCESVAVLDQHAYVAGGQAGIYVIDTSIPSTPVLKQTIPTDTESDAVAIAVVRTLHGDNVTDVALLNEGTEGIHTFNITNPDSCYSFEQGTTAFNAQNMYIDQTDAASSAFVYLADSRGGIKIFEYLPETPSTLPPESFHIDIDRRAMSLVVRGGYAYVACDQLGLTEVDIRTPSAPTITGWADTRGNALDIALKDDFAFVADGTEGIVVFQIKEGSDPEWVAAIDLSGYSRSIVIRDNLACLASAGGGVHFVDITNPRNPVYLGTVVTSYATDIAISTDGLIVVSDRFDGIYLLGSSTSFSDTKPPAAVRNLRAEQYTTSHVNLYWTATGDDGAYGKASAYDLRWSTEPIDEISWDNATPVAGLSSPPSSGTHQKQTVSGLPAETACYFAMKVSDDVGNISNMSNLTQATTLGGIALVNPRVDPLVSTAIGSSFTFKIDYNHENGAEPDWAKLIINGNDDYNLSLSSEPTDLPNLYTYSRAVQLDDWGAYRYRFRFDDALGNSCIHPNVDGPFVGHIVINMGSPENELGRRDDETLHRVIVFNFVQPDTNIEVTQDMWQRMGFDLPADLPQHFRNPNNPIVNISWYDAIRYCNRLSEADGRTPVYDTSSFPHVTWNQQANGWRLPTEAEWEFLCRARTTTAFYNGNITVEFGDRDPKLDLVGWYHHDGSDHTLKPVAQLAPNAFGLYDMHGNVAEWCWDFYGPYPDDMIFDPVGPEQGELRVIRGGHWDAYARDCRSAARGYHYPDSGDDYIGFRVIRTSDIPWPPSR